MHKRPRKAVMRLASLDASITGRSNVLLDRARMYLTGDEVFEELYAHAVDLEEKIDNETLEEINDGLKDTINEFREAVDGVHDDLERKHKERNEVVARITNVLDDEVLPKLSQVLALVSGDAADKLMEIQEHLKALTNDADDIPVIEEEIGALKEAWEVAGSDQ
jgi:ABC-type transporter Mla subunit MlaD